MSAALLNSFNSAMITSTRDQVLMFKWRNMTESSMVIMSIFTVSNSSLGKILLLAASLVTQVFHNHNAFKGDLIMRSCDEKGVDDEGLLLKVQVGRSKSRALRLQRHVVFFINANVFFRYRFSLT